MVGVPSSPCPLLAGVLGAWRGVVFAGKGSDRERDAFCSVKRSYHVLFWRSRLPFVVIAICQSLFAERVLRV